MNINKSQKTCEVVLNSFSFITARFRLKQYPHNIVIIDIHNNIIIV